MRNLLSAGFTRMRKSVVFWIGIAAMFLIGADISITSYINKVENGCIMSADNGLFAYSVFIVIVLAVFISLFIGTEYSDGTIRNKLIAGQKRSIIYLSNYIICVVAAVLMCISFFISFFSIGIPLLDPFEIEIKAMLKIALFIFCMILAFVALYLLIAMLIQNKAIVAVICIIGCMGLLLAGTIFNAFLNEPEYYDAYSYTDESGHLIEEERQKNPNYLTGNKRKAYEFLLHSTPGGQTILLADMRVEKPALMLSSSLLIAVAASAAGIIVFKRKDIK